MSASRRETLDQRIAALTPAADLYCPQGKGPFAVVIQLHGCGGKKGFQADWAKVAQRAGWAVLVIDSYAHRNISSLQAYATVCTGLRLWGRERAGDLYAAMEWVRRQPWADTGRIAVAGWSHGGWTALDAMCLAPGTEAANATQLEGLPDNLLDGLAGAFLVYPFVGPGCLARTRGIRVDVPVLGLVGTHDVIVGGRIVGRTLQRLKTPRLPIRVEILEGATHAFDEPGANDLRVRHDPALTERAHGLYADFLKQLATH